MDLSAGAQKLMGYWGAVESAVSQRVSTADLWGAVRQAAADLGETLSGISATDMSVLRGIAAGVRNAASSFASAAETNALDSSMIAQAPWSRDLTQQNLAPMTQARFQQTVEVEGVAQTLWRTVIIEGQLPSSVGELVDLLNTQAQEIADAHGTTTLGIDSIQLLGV